jgi:diguanylate cyclase (GGDEF)-like protein/PAS domain S-box-containing protein
MLVPTWLLFLAWLAGTGLTVNGQLTSEIAQPALAGGLVLLVLLLGFTVMQHAFAGGVIAEGVINDQERRALALTGAGDVVWDWDVGRDRIHTSGEAEHSLGFKRGALEGPARDWLEVLHPRDRDRFRATLDAVVEHRGRISQTFRLRTEDGHYLWYLLRARPILGTDGEVVRCVGTLVDVTDTKTAQERLLHDAVNDNLTGLPNRELFLDRLAGAITRCQADETLRPSVFLLDLDRFRQINESLGIPVGDSILLTVARRLGRILKPLDTLGRVEGDQFGIILSSESAPDRVAAFADALRRAIRAPITFSDREIFLTASVGIVMVDRTAKDQNDVLKDAELAMAYAKRAGGDRIETFRPSLRSTANDALAFEEDLRRALERDEMKVLFQPILRLEDRAIAGYEALLRWDHPKRGRVSPVDFIPVAERSGQIVDLGLFALDRAARQLSAWQQITGRESLFVSVNISSRQLVRHELINDVKAILTRAALPTGTLKLELTESIVMENPEFASQILQRLRELGAGLALDDFGTGYSSLAYLQRFPFDTIKIDQSFLRGTGGKRSVILKTMIDLAHDLEMDVVVEGVETEADVQTLTNDGAEFGQGFLLGKPMSADEVTTALEKKPAKVKA